MASERDSVGGGPPDPQAAKFRRRLENGDYDFLDLGAGVGGSLDFARRTFDAGPGLGLDLDAVKVRAARGAGYDVIAADLTQAELPAGCVSFVSAMDFLEHLPNFEAAHKILVCAGRAARDALFIRHPSFEDIGALAERGLKLTWTDWHGHRNMMTLSDFGRLFDALGWDERIVIPRGRIRDASHEAVLPLDAPRDLQRYDEDAHGPKPGLRFDWPVYAQFDILVRLPTADGAAPGDAAPTRFAAMSERLRRPSKGALGRVAQWIAEPARRLLSGRPADAVLEDLVTPRLAELRKRSLLHRGWNWLRSLHLRAAFAEADRPRSVLAVGVERGYAELALAVEFADVEFTFVPLSSVDGGAAGGLPKVCELVDAWGLPNVRIEECRVADLPTDCADLVMVAGLLERVEDDRAFASQLMRVSRRQILALTPYADAAARADRGRAERVLASHGLLRVGYDGRALRDLLCDAGAVVRGCYWADHGVTFREVLAGFSDEEIRQQLEALDARARQDLRDAEPQSPGEAQGLWVLARPAPERAGLRSALT